MNNIKNLMIIFVLIVPISWTISLIKSAKYIDNSKYIILTSSDIYARRYPCNDYYEDTINNTIIFNNTINGLDYKISGNYILIKNKK